MKERGTVRTLVLEIEGPARRAARLLAGRFPGVVCERRGLRLPIGAGESPEAVLACCRERGIGVSASRVHLRHPGNADASPVASASPSAGEIER